MPQLELPCVPLYGKEGTKGKPLDITAQVSLTFSCDGRRVTVPTFIQPESEQKCLIGMNVIPFLGITICRANGKPLHAVVEHDAQVRLVHSTTIPSMKGRVVEAQLENSDSFRGSELLFQPEHKVLDGLGVWTQESLITVQPDGRAFIPLQNFQGTSIKLDEGVHLGVASLCDIPRQDEPVKVTEPKQGNGALLRSTCASVKALINTPERYERLRSVLDFPDTLDAYQIENFKQLLMKSTDVFALNDSELGCTDVVSHNIDTGDKLPVKQPPYRAPMIYREKIAEMVMEMQERGIVQPSMSPWASPVILVPKKDGSLRFCVDFRKLNALTKKDVYPLPRVDDILDTLGDAKYFSTLDLASGYWKIPLDAESRPKTAFTTHQGLFEFVRMPFGLCNAPATFQRAMQSVLAGLEWRDCFVYIDDILVVSRTFEEHLRHLEQIFDRLRNANLRLKPKKCSFLCNKVTYLGHVISVEGVCPDPEKTEKVRSFPVPRDVTQVRQFIGLASYYRRFVPKFAQIASPLHALLKKDNTFQWSVECSSAFQQLKDLLTSSPVLVFPKFGPGCEFILETDASYVGLGAVLSQQQEDGSVHPIAYASRSLDQHERNYGVTELETLGLVWAVRYFRSYILGHRTIVYTDHSACLSLLNHPRPSGKLARWAMTIQEMDLIIKHRSGKSNTNADALSRNPVCLNPTNVNVNSCIDANAQPQAVNPRPSYMNKREPSSSDGHQPKESAPKPPERAGGSNSDGGHPARALSCVIGETLPKPSFNKKCPADAVADHEFEKNYHKENKKKFIFDSISDCDCIQKTSHEIRELQIKDNDLLPYFQYLEEGKLPENE